MAARAIALHLDLPGLATLIAAGEDEFCRVARIGFAGQDFHQEDFQRMFVCLKWQLQEDLRLHPTHGRAH
jgi:hypothetical protein